MAWTSPTTRATGELITASIWNTDLVNNLNALRGPPQARATHSAAQSIASGAFTALAFDTERFDNDAIHDTVTNNSRLTCKSAGKYLVGGQVEFAVNGNGQRFLQIFKNGATSLGEQGVPNQSATHAARIGVVTLADLAVNDYVELKAFQDSGGNLNVTKSNELSPEFWMVRQG